MAAVRSLHRAARGVLTADPARSAGHRASRTAWTGDDARRRHGRHPGGDGRRRRRTRRLHGRGGRRAAVHAVRRHLSARAVRAGRCRDLPRRLGAPDYPAGYPLGQHERILQRVRGALGQRAGGHRALRAERAEDAGFRGWYGRCSSTRRARDRPSRWYRVVRRDRRPARPADHSRPDPGDASAEDMVVPVEHGRYMAAHIPGAKYVELPGEEHFLVRGRLGRGPRPSRGVRHRRRVRAACSIACSRPCCSPTSSTPRVAPPSWATAAGANCSTATTLVCARELSRFRGREVKTAGDGFLAVFDGPARAIRCAARSAMRVRGSGSRSAPACTPASARCAATTSAGWPSTSARGSRRWPVRRGAGVQHCTRPRRRLRHRVRRSRRARLKGVPGEWQLFAVVPARA